MKYFSYLILFNINICFSQILPPSLGFYNKKTASSSEESFVLDFDNDDDCTSGCGTSFYGEVNWSTNMSEDTVSMWV